ncbi:hypothetical protein DU002_05960 [Corallincola holothuriorum]|uniref:Tse2 ADP-ribosyltransferase toxin domain-containing protein n=1 Tax=Corallincola holothuriorum TaxID=2282215 RepID=A0A368NN28_9GAMM|nr:hypothetical protein [Corallincola holothuriorum]RCU50869.1 hypothetical protein DU002_05960 [Corallincola holothuriorum]
MITLEEIIVRRGDIEKIYRSERPLTLWRGLHNSEVNSKSNPLYPDFYRKTLPNGDIREPDVTVVKDEESGKEIVFSEEGVGTSLVDKEGIFGHKNWQYFTIPKGTHIPEELVITKDHYIARKKCWHYSISPNYSMSKEELISALDKLAYNAGIRVKGVKHA